MEKDGKREAQSTYCSLILKIWGQSPEHATAASEKNNMITVMTSPQCFLYLWLLLGWTYLFVEINWEQTTVHNDLTTNVIGYQYKRCHYKQAKCYSLTEMLSSPIILSVISRKHQTGLWPAGCQIEAAGQDHCPSTWHKTEKRNTWLHKYSQHIHLHFVAELIKVHQ